MLVGRRLKRERLWQFDIFYALERDGHDIGRFTYHPHARWSEVVLDGRYLLLGREASSLREALAQTFAAAPAKPFILRDETGRVLAQADRRSLRVYTFARSGTTFTARKPVSFRQYLEIKAESGDKIGAIGFRGDRGERQIFADLPVTIDVPTQILLFGLLHDLMLNNEAGD